MPLPLPQHHYKLIFTAHQYTTL